MGATLYLWKPREMRNVDEAVFSKFLGECVSDLRHSGWRLDEPGVGSGPCIWGTCAFSRDRKIGMESQNLSLYVFFFLNLVWTKKKNKKFLVFLTMPQICMYTLFWLSNATSKQLSWQSLCMVSTIKLQSNVFIKQWCRHAELSNELCNVHFLRG